MNKKQQRKDKEATNRKFNGKIMWTASTVHVNIDTAEVITKEQSKKLLYVRTTKYAAITNYNKTRGHIQYIMEYRTNPQGNLNL